MIADLYDQPAGLLCEGDGDSVFTTRVERVPHEWKNQLRQLPERSGREVLKPALPFDSGRLSFEALVHRVRKRIRAFFCSGSSELNSDSDAHSFEDLAATIDLVADRPGVLAERFPALAFRLELELSGQHGDAIAIAAIAVAAHMPTR